MYISAADRAVKGLAERGETLVYLAADGALSGAFAITDPIRPNSRAAIAALTAQGVSVALISGDRQATAQAIASELGISHVVAEVLPSGKVDAVKALGDRVAFVGDGINDAPALAAAHVGLAMGTGTDVAMEAADVVLVSGDPMGASTALNAARRTMRNIRQNLGWAFSYNAALIPVAAGVLYPAFGLLLAPMFAAAAMALSSIFVVSNALRLRFLGR